MSDYKELKDMLDDEQNFSDNYKKKLVPPGGTAGQRLEKAGNEDGNTQWGDDPDYSGVYAAIDHDHDDVYEPLYSVGDRQFTEENVVTNGQSVTESIDALDVAVGMIDAALAAIIGEDIDADL